MAKKRLNIKDKTGLPVDYDISAENVTIDGEGGKPLTEKLDEIAEAEAQAVRSITFNGQSYSRDNGSINIGEQEQPNWNESNPNYRTYIRNKPTLLSQFVNDCGFVTSSQIPEGADLSTVFASVAYDPTTSRINFFGKGSNTVLAYLDAAPFIVDGMVENVTLDSSTNELVITFNTASGKSPIRVSLGSISGQGTVQSVKMNGGTPIQPVNGVIDLGTVITEHQSLSSYATRNYVDQAVQQAEQGETVVINSDGANIVDSHTNPSILIAPSARQMAMAYYNIEALKDKINDLYSRLAGIAFSDGKPSPWSAATDWSTPAISKHTITIGTLTDVSASIGNAAITNSIQADEGEVTITLTPAQDKALADADIHIQLNGTDVAFTRSGNNVTFILAGDVTVSATARGGINVELSNMTNVTSNKSSVTINTEEVITLNKPEHYSWSGDGYADIVVTQNGTSITSRCTIAELGETITIQLPDNLNDTTHPIVISGVSASENPYKQYTWADEHITVTKNGIPVTASSVKVWSDEVVNSSVVLVFKFTDGYKWSSAPTIDGVTAADVYSPITVTIASGTIISSNSDISVGSGNTITTALTPYTITPPSDANITTEVSANGNAVNESDGVFPVHENDNVNIVLRPASGYKIAIDTITMGANTLTDGDYTIIDNNGLKTIAISVVDGDIVVGATAVNVNTAFKNVRFYKQSIVPKTQIRIEPSLSYVTSPLIDVHSYENLTFNCGSSQNLGMFCFDQNGEYMTYWSADASDKTVSTSTSVGRAYYVRISFLTENKDNAFIKVKDAPSNLWSGTQISDVSALPGAEDFINSPYFKPNFDENGNCLNIFYDDLSPNLIVSLSGDSEKGLSPLIAMPRDSITTVDNEQVIKSKLTFGLVEGYDYANRTSVGLVLYEQGEWTRVNYYQQNKNPRTEDVSGDYYYARYQFDLDNKNFAYILNANKQPSDNDYLLWGADPRTVVE